MAKANTAPGWQVGGHVATPNGFVAEIVSLTDERARIRYLGAYRNSEEIDLPLTMLRPATARDLLLMKVK